MAQDVGGEMNASRGQALQDKLENTQQEAQDKKEANQIKAFEQLLQSL